MDNMGESLALQISGANKSIVSIDKMVHYRKKPDDGTVLNLPDKQATITIRPFTTAISFNHEGDAYLEPLNTKLVDKLKFQNEKLYFEGQLQELSEADIQNIVTKDYLNNIDLSFLRIIYSAILKDYERANYKKNSLNIVLYVPDLLRSLGKKSNQSQEQIKALINDVNQYKNVVGVIKKKNGNKVYKNYYSLLNFNYYEQENNIISLNAPYLEYIVKYLYELSIRKDKNGKPRLAKSGKVLTLPTHSYLIKSEIAKERNRTAIENVNIIVTLIEQAGNGTPHISAQTIVDRNPLLNQRLQECIPKNRQRILDRTFKRTWELLHTMTLLKDTYLDISLPNPDPKELTSYPKLNELDKTVYKFAHSGKIRENNKNKNSK
jgi:hypothetical protein